LAVPDLRAAVADFSWLLGRGYAPTSSLKLVGDRYRLSARQRLAVLRSSSGDAALASRTQRQRPLGQPAGEPLLIDGYNLLITVESALSGGVVLQGRDRCCRDLASLHGTYRAVEETAPAVILVGETLARASVGLVAWFLDAPVSNSGRLAALIRDLGRQRGWSWSAELAPDPDRVLASSPGVVASSDSWILDRCQAWSNLAREVIASGAPEAWVVDLGPEA
jgi:hypothetical protein